MKKSMKTKSFETEIFKGWNWDIAEANYCIQYNKKGTDLSEEDVALHLNGMIIKNLRNF